MTDLINRYRKAITAFAGFVVLVVGNELGTNSKWYLYVVAALTAAGVSLVPNKP